MGVSTDVYTKERVGFAERVAKLAGTTTYRVPTLGRGGQMSALPDSHAIAAALAFGRRRVDGRVDDKDIGPDFAYCWIIQSDAYRREVTRKLAEAMGETLGHLGRRNRPFLRYIAECAWDSLVWGHRCTRPIGMTARSWGMLMPAAIGVLQRCAWDTLAEAERAYHKAA